MERPSLSQLQHDQQVLEVLTALSYRTGELDAYLHEITRSISYLLMLDWAIVTLCQEEGRGKVIASNLELKESDRSFSLHGALAGVVIETQRSLIIEDIRHCSEYGGLPEGYLCYLGMPLRVTRGDTIGTICCFNRVPRQFTPEEIQTLELMVERAATAIENYRLYQQQRQLNAILEEKVARRTEELLATQTRLGEQERWAVIGEFAAMIVHEIRNPLTTMAMGLRHLQKSCSYLTEYPQLSLALSATCRLERLLHHLLLYAKPQVLHLEEVDLNAFLEALLPSLRSLETAQNKNLQVVPPATSLKLLGDRNRLQQMITQIVDNACEAIAPGETVTLMLREAATPGWIALEVHNPGTIPADVLMQLPRPFYTTKPDGVGLGLAIAQRIVEAHHGRLQIESDVTVGTIVRIELPPCS